MRALTLALLALTISFAAVGCGDPAPSDGDGGGGSGSGGSGAGGSGAGGSGPATCNDQSAITPVGNCFYSGLGFCAEWSGESAGDPATWADTCSGDGMVWTTGEHCAIAGSIGSCKDTSGTLTTINTYYEGGAFPDTATAREICLDPDDASFACSTWTDP